ncbi:TOMM precursor leader peptide-binding protein [Microbispora sp. NPDC088329]|uniref:TOMM precursor leader peptide-binding protein n=1 Tax=Microbispora sp. NPDC088329 TaxID=3154869 RepID=UPI003422C780
MTVDMTQAVPLPAAERSRREVEEPLIARLNGITPFVRILGLRDELESPSPWTPPGAKAVLPVYLYDSSAIVGPVADMTPSGPSTPCPRCVAGAWQQLRTEDERDALEEGSGFEMPHPVPFVIPFSVETLCLVAEVARQRHTDHAGHPYIYDVRLDTGEVRRFPLVSNPDCGLCGVKTPDSPDEAVITLPLSPKRSADSFRGCPSGSYNLSVDAYAAPVVGALGKAARHRLDSTTAAPTIGYVAVRGDGYMHYAFWGGHADNFDESVRLGILEGLERNAGQRPRRIAGSVVGSYRELAGQALDPKECGVYSPEFYRLNPQYTPYSDDLDVPWVWGYSLRDERPILVPEVMAYYHVNGLRNKFLQECSNGCAAGGSMTEAILYGLLELVERDAFLLTWYGRRTPLRIDPASCDEPATRAMIDRISLSGYDVHLFDARVDLDIPVVVAMGVRRNGGYGTVCFGAGASLDPRQAVDAALCEIASTVPGFAFHAEEEADELRALAANYWLVVSLHDHPRLFGLPEMAPTTAFLTESDAPPLPLAEVYRDWNRVRPRTLDLRDDLRFCVERITDAGMDVVVVNQTSPEQERIGLHTAAVIAPGLLPIDFGWARQRCLRMPRMRSAFRRAGWRTTDLRDDEMNLVPHPFP